MESSTKIGGGTSNAPVAFAAGALVAAAGMTLVHSCMHMDVGGTGRADRHVEPHALNRSAGRILERRYTGDGLLESGGDFVAAPALAENAGSTWSGGVADVDASRFISAASSMTSSTATQPKKLRITVLGGGNFGTAMAYASSRNGHQVTIWMRDAAQARYFNETQRNPKYLSEYTLPKNVHATTDLAEAMDGVQLIFHALPCQKTPEWMAQHKESIPRDVLICSTVKGLYLPTKQLIGHAMCDALGRDQVMFRRSRLAEAAANQSLIGRHHTCDFEKCSEPDQILHRSHWRTCLGHLFQSRS